MGLKQYHKKRDFKKTQEPKGTLHKKDNFLFVIQKHAASHLHYDFRLALDGVLKSWAIPKGPCLDPEVKRLAIHVEDHPIEYGNFEGIIPKGQYGGGTVMLWDKGHWKPLDDDPRKAYEKGHLRIELEAEKLKGRWDLIRFKKEENSWFLIKYQDKYAKSQKDYDITAALSKSVLTNQSIEEIAENYDAEWSRQGLKKKIKTIDFSSLPKSSFPKIISPQLAALVDKAPEGGEWLHEIKFDGYRILAYKNGNKVALFSRNKKDWTDKFSSIAEEIKKLPVKNAVLDGEVVVLDDKSLSDFQLLQNSIKGRHQAPFKYYIFDLLYYQNWDLRSLPLLERKSLIPPLLTSANKLLYSDHIIGSGKDLFQQVCDLKLEGLISKKITSKYLSRRSPSWLKVKCIKRQEFVVGGFSPPQGSRSCFGSLFLGYYNKEGDFIFSGNVGTGFTELSLQEVYSKLKKIQISKCPFNSHPPGYKTAQWVKPDMVVEVAFTEWTQDGRLRHPSFKGLRRDKKAGQVIKEEEENVEKVTKNKTAVVLSNPQKILYSEEGYTKQDIFNYYDQIFEYILPHISNRPLTLVRCPDNYKKCFYQKRLHPSSSKFLHPIAIEHKNDEKDEEPYIYLNDLDGLLGLVQMGVLEIHPWGSKIANLDYPDQIIFDLDPDPNLPWKKVVEAAFKVKEYFQELHLTSFVKTTGGKGLHVVIPITPEYSWDEVKNFTHAFVEFLERNEPEKYLSNMAKSKRKGKIFVDYLRNQKEATAIAAYSTRAKLHATVAVPLAWDELTNQSKDAFYTIKTLPKRLKHLKNDPWENFFKIKQSLTSKL